MASVDFDWFPNPKKLVTFFTMALCFILQTDRRTIHIEYYANSCKERGEETTFLSSSAMDLAFCAMAPAVSAVQFCACWIVPFTA